MKRNGAPTADEIRDLLARGRLNDELLATLLPELIEKHGGQWVAVDDGKWVVASTLEEVSRTAREQGFDPRVVVVTHLISDTTAVLL